MIETHEGLTVSLEQLAKLRAWERNIVADVNQHPRMKKSELAGIRRMIAEIEREIRSYNLSRLRSTLNELEEQSQKLNANELPMLLSRKIRDIREAADAMQPVI